MPEPKSESGEQKAESGKLKIAGHQAPPILYSLISSIENYSLLIILAVSLVGVLGSLYYSEIEHLPPCNLCWNQRVFLYPIAIIAAVGMLAKQKPANIYILVFGIPGMLIGGYQYMMQMTGFGAEGSACALGASCSEVNISLLGFITIPLMSFVAFVVINLVAGLSVYLNSRK